MDVGFSLHFNLKAMKTFTAEVSYGLLCPLLAFCCCRFHCRLDHQCMQAYLSMQASIDPYSVADCSCLYEL